MNSKKVSDCCNATVIETFVEDKRPLCSICYKPCSVHEEVEGEGWEWEKHLLTEFEKKEGVKLFDLLHKAVCLHDEHSSSRPYIEEVLSKFLNFLRPAIKSLLLEERKRAVLEYDKRVFGVDSIADGIAQAYYKINNERYNAKKELGIEEE